MIKNRKRMLVMLPLLFLAGCYEVNEEIVIQNDGSGTYSTHMDMGQLVEMIQMYASEEEMNKQGMNKVTDTTILMSSIADSAKDLTGPQREILRTGKMRLQINFKEKLFKVDMDFVFKNFIQLHDLMGGLGNNSSTLSQAFKKMFGNGNGNENPDSTQLDVARDPSLDNLNKIYNVIAEDGLLSKSADTAKLNALLQQPQMEQVRQMGSSGLEILYTTMIRLPRQAKKVESPVAKLSEDRRTVTLRYNLLDMFDHPENLNYRIEY